jgi:hypothetical protein
VLELLASDPRVGVEAGEQVAEGRHGGMLIDRYDSEDAFRMPLRRCAKRMGRRPTARLSESV